MARRKATIAGSALGWAFVVMIGLIVWIVNTVSQFVQENWALIRIGLVFGAIALVLWLLSRLFRRPGNPTPATKGLAAFDSNGYATREAPSLARPSRIFGAVAKWICPGEVIKVQGFTLSSGLFYFGEVAPGGSRERGGQYVVNPRLPIGSGPPDLEGASMPYWPSYEAIRPDARRAFLQWMQDGRRDPRCGIGCKMSRSRSAATIRRAVGSRSSAAEDGSQKRMSERRLDRLGAAISAEAK